MCLSPDDGPPAPFQGVPSQGQEYDPSLDAPDEHSPDSHLRDANADATRRCGIQYGPGADVPAGSWDGGVDRRIHHRIALIDYGRPSGDGIRFFATDAARAGRLVENRELGCQHGLQFGGLDVTERQCEVEVLLTSPAALLRDLRNQRGGAVTSYILSPHSDINLIPLRTEKVYIPFHPKCVDHQSLGVEGPLGHRYRVELLAFRSPLPGAWPTNATT